MKKYSKTCKKIKILYKIKKRVQFTCSLSQEVLFTKLLTLTAQKTIPVPAIQKASFYSFTQLSVSAVLRACCSGSSMSLLFWLSKKLSVLAVQKAFFYCCSESLLLWLLAMLPGLAVQKYVCSGCTDSFLFWLFKNSPVLAVKKACSFGCQESFLVWQFREPPVVATYSESFPFQAVLKASFSGCRVSMSSSFFKEDYSTDTWRSGA